MPYEHRIPDVLEPTGDLIVPLIIPHDPQWSGLILGVLRTLEDLDYYNRDSNFDDENAKIVTAQWRDRTITPLIEAIATGQTIGGQSLKITPKTIVIANDRTTTSVTYVDIVDSDFAFTFTYPKATIEAIALMANAANANTFLQVLVDGNTGLLSVETRIRNVTAVARYVNNWEDLPVGTPVTIKSQFKVSNNTGTVFAGYNMLYLITEHSE